MEQVVSVASPGELEINQFKARVEFEIRRRRWSYSRLAQEMEISRQALSKALIRGYPTGRGATLARFCRVFGLTERQFREPLTEEEFGIMAIPRFDVVVVP